MLLLGLDIPEDAVQEESDEEEKQDTEKRISSMLSKVFLLFNFINLEAIIFV